MRRKGSRARRNARIEDVPERSQKLLDRLGLRAGARRRGLSASAPWWWWAWAMGHGLWEQVQTGPDAACTRAALRQSGSCESGQDQDRFRWPEYLAAWDGAQQCRGQRAVVENEDFRGARVGLARGVAGRPGRRCQAKAVLAVLAARATTAQDVLCVAPLACSLDVDKDAARSRSGRARVWHESCASPARVLREQKHRRGRVGGQQSDGAKETAGIKRMRRWAGGRRQRKAALLRQDVRMEGKSDRMRRNEPE